METLITGAAAEALGILNFNGPQLIDQCAGIKRATSDAVQAILDKYPECQNGIGKLKDYQVTLNVKDNVTPTACPTRPAPFHLRSQLRKELDKMEAEGIIEEHHGPAPWVSNIVLSPKENGLRVTVDMRKPNEAIQDTNIPTPRVEDIRAQMSEQRIFTKLDLKAAFHQLELAPESRYLTVFNDGHRLMRYTRLTMGTKPASGELNKALRPLFTSMPNAHVIHDDIVIAAPDEATHDEALDRTLAILSANGLTLNTEKCIFKETSIPFWGMKISKDGVEPDENRVQALREASRPTTKEEVMSFICMIQSFSEFIPNLSRQTIHLRKLTQKCSRFHWDAKCETEFVSLKEVLSGNALLAHFSPKKTTFIFVDAHQSGLSAILAQGETIEKAKMVSCASRTTTPVERRYPQLDLEALAVDFAMRRYRQFLVGGPTVFIVTDHKPLVSIFGSARKGSIRTDRIQLRHQDISYKVIWRQGKDNPADYLSRHAVLLKKNELAKGGSRTGKDCVASALFSIYRGTRHGTHKAGHRKGLHHAGHQGKYPEGTYSQKVTNKASRFQESLQ